MPSVGEASLHLVAELRDANQARRHGDLDGAEARYRRALALDADNGRATAGFALVQLGRSRAEAAVLWAQRLVRIRSDAGSHWVLLGDALRLDHDDATARRAYERALEAEPGFEPAQQRLQELSAP